MSKRFDMKSLRNPVDEVYVCAPLNQMSQETLPPLTFKLRPLETDIVFEGSRWQGLQGAGSFDAALQTQFSIGLNRIVGWQGLEDEHGNPLVFNRDNLALLARHQDAIPYFLDIGAKTLLEMGMGSVSGNEQKGSSSAEASITPGDQLIETSDNNTTMPSKSETDSPTEAATPE